MCVCVCVCVPSLTNAGNESKNVLPLEMAIECRSHKYVAYHTARDAEVFQTSFPWVMRGEPFD